MKKKSIAHLLSAATFCALIYPTLNHATELPVGFVDSDLSEWEEESFVGYTEYEIQTDGNTSVLRASTDGAASVLYKRKTIDITDTPMLEWEWKIDSVYDIDNEKVKSGDDFPARLYVTAKTGPLPWQTIAINYVWSSNQPIGAWWPSPFTKKSIMVVVQSGSAKSGQWVAQERNIVDDFNTFFDKEVKEIPGIAIMVDGDNSAQTGTAYFGRIAFTPNGKNEG